MRDYDLSEMQAQQRWRLDWRSLFEIKGDVSAEDTVALDAYFRRFTPMPEGRCISCGKTQGGLMGALLGGFQYGIVHGEGRCSSCGWPGRANHYDIGPIKFFNVILQYHPDELIDHRSTAVNE